MRSTTFSLSLLLIGCAQPGNLCEIHFVPYPDMVSGRVRTAENAALLDGMAVYADGDHSAAIPLLRDYLAANEHEAQARLYLASSLIAIGEPFDAELQMDLMEREHVHTFKDQMEWYRTICLLCSDQRDRAMQAAAAIASSLQHTYHKDAVLLLEDLRAE